MADREGVYVSEIIKVPSRVRDIRGERFGRLVVTEFGGYKGAKPRAYWRCTCDCGGEIITRSDALQKGRAKSCGCLHREVAAATAKATRTTHGQSGTKTYWIWAAMKDRCLNPNSTDYYLYGARGITVCERWLDFGNFYADMGSKPAGLSLDRIDNSQSYGPDNCRWATDEQQSSNRRPWGSVRHGKR